MALVIDDLVMSVQAVGTLVRESASLVKEIRSLPLFARNADAQKKLESDLNELETRLKNAGQLADAAEEYSRTRENVLELLWLCRRAERFLKDSVENKEVHIARNAGAWRVIEEIFQTIDGNREATKKAVMGLAQWYDVQDQSQIPKAMNDFEKLFDGASRSMRNRLPLELLHDLQGMTAALQDADTPLQNTLYSKILKTIQKIA